MHEASLSLSLCIFCIALWLISLLALRMNSSHILSTAIEPPIALSLTDMAKPNSFIVSEETTYSINIGAEFGIRCSSEVIHADDEISGKVTWYKEPG